MDLAPIKPIRGVKTILGDITTQQCRAAIRKEAGGSLMDVVLHDGARLIDCCTAACLVVSISREWLCSCTMVRLWGVSCTRVSWRC